MGVPLGSPTTLLVAPDGFAAAEPAGAAADPAAEAGFAAALASEAGFEGAALVAGLATEGDATGAADPPPQAARVRDRKSGTSRRFETI